MRRKAYPSINDGRVHWRPDDHRRDPGRHPEPEQPTPREIKALKAVEDGSSLSQAGKKLGLSSHALGAILSHAYDRLKIKDLASHRLSQERRALAIKVCKDHGWWPE